MPATGKVAMTCKVKDIVGLKKNKERLPWIFITPPMNCPKEDNWHRLL